MSLLDDAAADLQGFLTDDVSGFAVPVTLVSPDEDEVELKGLANDIGRAIDPETGVAVLGQAASVALSLMDIADAGLGQPCAVPERERKPWLVILTLPTGGVQTFKVSSTMPDKLGCLVCFLETYTREDS